MNWKGLLFIACSWIIAGGAVWLLFHFTCLCTEPPKRWPEQEHGRPVYTLGAFFQERCPEGWTDSAKDVLGIDLGLVAHADTFTNDHVHVVWCLQ